jgi:hypothetical protein
VFTIFIRSQVIGAEDKVQLCGYLVSKGDKDFMPTQKIAAVTLLT